MPSAGGRVCPTCSGRGRIYRFGATQPCPDCPPLSAPDRRALGQHEAVERLASCWARFKRGETGIANLELAARGAFATGLGIEALHRRCGVPTSTLRKLYTGQALLC